VQKEPENVKFIQRPSVAVKQMMWNIVKKDSIKNTIWGDIDEE
jgi:hypothetical protein